MDGCSRLDTRGSDVILTFVSVENVVTAVVFVGGEVTAVDFAVVVCAPVVTVDVFAAVVTVDVFVTVVAVDVFAAVVTVDVFAAVVDATVVTEVVVVAVAAVVC